MTFSDASVTSIIIQALLVLPATVAASAAWRRGKRTEQKTDILTDKADVTKELAGNNLAISVEDRRAIRAELDVANRHIRELQVQIHDLKVLVASLVKSDRRRAKRIAPEGVPPPGRRGIDGDGDGNDDDQNGGAHA